MDLPARIFCGVLPPGAVWWVLRTQLLWSLALAALGRVILAFGMRRVTIAGG
jgi:ABC-type uncharacterized transport system permease subunit